MHHGDEAHTGYVSDTPITRLNVGTLELRHELVLDGPVLSTPAVVSGFVYVGVANSRKALAQNGGSFYKVELHTGQIAAVFHWDIAADERDTHGFCGMGCTPAIRGGRVYFSAFNGKCYCLDQETLALIWVVDLRYADPRHAQPVTNDAGVADGNPPAAGWSSPVVAGDRVFLGIGEGENPFLFSFVFCLDALTGDVLWIFCTCQFDPSRANRANELPASTVGTSPLPPQYSVFSGTPVALGCSVWGSIAYDRDSRPDLLSDRQSRAGHLAPERGLLQRCHRPRRQHGRARRLPAVSSGEQLPPERRGRGRGRLPHPLHRRFGEPPGGPELQERRVHGDGRGVAGGRPGPADVALQQGWIAESPRSTRTRTPTTRT